MRRPASSRTLLLAALLGALLSAFEPAAAAAPAEPTPVFTDVSLSSGLDFVHFNGMSGELYFPEMTGQGGGVLDFDGDGDLDVYLVQGAMLGPGKSLDDALFPPRRKPPRDRLYRNDTVTGEDGSRTLRFTDVTEASGIDGRGYGMGVAAGDFDGDGRVDLYVTGFGPNRLYRNLGEGRFEDVTEESGTGDERWGTSASFLDFDRDGRLDLYVANYVEYDPAANKVCFSQASRKDYCGPSGFPPQADRLFRNRGDGSFEDVTLAMLRDYRPGPGLGVVASDLNGDGWVDLYVANDGAPNQLWINQQGKGFLEDALFAGAAVNMDGMAEASMGVDAADFDGDGDEDLFMTHLAGETNTLYVNDGAGVFEDRTLALGLASASFPYTAFGTAWFDHDGDGWLDLLVLNGAVRIVEELAQAGDPYPLHQPNQLFRNVPGKGGAAGRRFEEVRGAALGPLALSEVSRGAAFGDLDDDGDQDVVVFNNNGRARVLRNDAADGKRWLGLRLLDRDGRRTMVGARAELHVPGRAPLWRRSRADGSYCSSNDPRLLFGLGDGPRPTLLRIHWPDGDVEEWKDPEVDRYTTLRQGWTRARKSP